MNTALEPPVPAQPDHALQPVPVALDQDGQSGLVAVAGGVQEILVGSSVGAQGGLPIPVRGNAGCTFTALKRIVSRPPKTPTSQAGRASRNQAIRCGGANVSGKRIIRASIQVRRGPPAG